jgi:hypothetical protein
MGIIIESGGQLRRPPLFLKQSVPDRIVEEVVLFSESQFRMASGHPSFLFFQHMTKADPCDGRKQFGFHLIPLFSP